MFLGCVVWGSWETWSSSLIATNWFCVVFGECFAIVVGAVLLYPSTWLCKVTVERQDGHFQIPPNDQKVYLKIAYTPRLPTIQNIENQDSKTSQIWDVLGFQMVSGFIALCGWLYGFIPNLQCFRCCNGSFESTRMFRWPHRGQVVACFEGGRWAYGRSSWIWNISLFHINWQILLIKLSHTWHIHASWLFATATWHTDLHEAFGLARRDA